MELVQVWYKKNTEERAYNGKRMTNKMKRGRRSNLLIIENKTDLTPYYSDYIGILPR